MTSALLVPLVLLFGGVPPDEMRQIVADRLGRLDKLVIEVTAEVLTCPTDVSPLDPNNWTRYGEVYGFPHRVTIVRPNVLDEDLTDEPEKGYVPVVASLADGRYAQRHVRPGPRGFTLYRIGEDSAEHGTFRWMPLLQIFDVHIQDSPIPQLNTLRLFDEYEVTLRGAGESTSTYEVSVPAPEHGYTCRYEFDLNGRGTPLRFKTVLEFDAPELLPGTWEMHVLDVVEVNGAELPSEAVVTIDNPNVGDDYYGVHHFLVTAPVRVDESLTDEDVRIEPDLHSAVVVTISADATEVRRTYDANGDLIDEELLLSPQSLADGTYASRESLRWRWLIPGGAGALGALAVVALHLVVRRR